MEASFCFKTTAASEIRSIVCVAPAKLSHFVCRVRRRPTTDHTDHTDGSRKPIFVPAFIRVIRVIRGFIGKPLAPIEQWRFTG
jgi:hypothetical protein